MIFNIVTKNGSAVVSFCGAPNETITLSTTRGKKLFENIVLNSHGISTETYKVPVGTYIIKGKASSEILPNGRTVKIRKSTTTVATYPDGAIFWFGNGNKEGDSLYSGGFTLQGGHYPDKLGEKQNGGYSQIKKTDKNIGILSECPDSAGSEYANTLYFPKSNLNGYSYVNIYANCLNPSRIAFGFPNNKKEEWESSMYVSPTTDDYALYSMAIPSDRTDGYFAMSTFNITGGRIMAHASVRAVWRDTTKNYSLESLKSISKTIALSDTYRYGTLVSNGKFAKLSSLPATINKENYVGVGQLFKGVDNGKPYTLNDYNATMIPFPAVKFSGTSRRIKLSLYLYVSSKTNRTFRWAISTSRQNENAYINKGAVNDSNQLASGIFTARINGEPNEFLFECEDIPVSTPLYIYLWRDNDAYGNVHVQNKVVVSLVYTEE